MVALEIKYKAPKAHTLLELVYVRWGREAHLVRCVPSCLAIPNKLLPPKPASAILWIVAARWRKGGAGHYITRKIGIQKQRWLGLLGTKLP